jgi:glutathione peroxidase
MTKIILTLIIAMTSIISSAQNKTKSIYDFKVKNIDGGTFDFATLKGKKIIIVNTASECGNTPQYADLEQLYKKHKSKNLVIIGFPANNFGGQEPGSDSDIKSFCSKKYAVTFPMMSKISVKGADMAPIYKWLTEKAQNGVKDESVTWNFQKFLIDEKGNWVGSVTPRTSPSNSPEINAFLAR